MARLSRRSTSGAVYAALRKKFGAKDGNSKKTPLDRLMFSMLALRASSQDAERGLSIIRSTYVDWNEFRVASQRNVSVLVKAKGCNPRSAENMKAFLQRLYQDTHTVSIAPLLKMSGKRAREYMERTTGMRAEQASSVLTSAFDMSVPPVHPAIKRIIARLGMLPQDASETRFHDAFHAIAAKGKPSTAYRVLQMLASIFCTKPKPLCPRCPVKKHCVTGQEDHKERKERKAAAKKKVSKKTAKKARKKVTKSARGKVRAKSAARKSRAPRRAKK